MTLNQSFENRSVSIDLARRMIEAAEKKAQYIGTDIVGAIGISGAHYEQDSECSHAAIAVLG